MKKTRFLTLLGALFAFCIILPSNGCTTKKALRAQIHQLESENFKLQCEKVTEKNKGIEQGRKQLAVAFQNIHRFEGVANHDSIITRDQAQRVKSYEKNWKGSLVHLRDWLPEWSFLDSIVRQLDTARIISIMEADTLGYFSQRPAQQLSIIPTTTTEYLLSQGQQCNAHAYYAVWSRMVVLRNNRMSKKCNYSYDNAITFLHELCHDYLSRKGFKGTVSDEHVWIATVAAEADTRFKAKCDRDGISYYDGVFIFEENKPYVAYLAIVSDFDSTKQELADLKALPVSIERNKKIAETQRKLSDLLYRKSQAEMHTEWFDHYQFSSN